ncbi:trafficking protein particle complex subunit 4 [Centruroides vittatus]|uniref:trafficking protein particle complex subunit 4 n=1 Tax=Centruroides vittatus TaxID=120091 RepID=UPI0035106734
MGIISVYVISKAGGLIYHYDHNLPKIEVEKTFSYPLEIVLEYQNKRVSVVYGQRDGIKVGHTLMSINGIAVNGRQLEDGRDVFDILKAEENYPINIKFGRPKLNTNEKIVLASMFHSLFAIATQLSPEPKSSGIEVLETDTFKLYCFQTITGVKFIIVADPKQAGIENLLRKIYEIYSDFALKNPFYSLEMPIRCELFDSNLQAALEQAEKTGISNV